MSQIPDTDYALFVYGTLRPGGRYYRQLCQGKGLIILPAYTQGEIYHLDLGYPGLTPGQSWVRGDLLCFSDAALMRAIDELEDFDPEGPEDANVYVRREAPVFDLNYQVLGFAERYEMPHFLIQHHGGRRVPDGDWSEDTIVAKLQG